MLRRFMLTGLFAFACLLTLSNPTETQAAGNGQQAGADVAEHRAEIIVPRRDVLGHGGTDFRAGGDGTGDEQLHGIKTLRNAMGAPRA